MVYDPRPEISTEQDVIESRLYAALDAAEDVFEHLEDRTECYLTGQERMEMLVKLMTCSQLAVISERLRSEN